MDKGAQMKIFTDESGDFSLTHTQNHSLVTSLICTEAVYEDIKRFMYAFENKFNNGLELKGSKLTPELRLRVCDFVKKNHEHLKISVTIISPEMVSQWELDQYRALQALTFKKNKNWYINAGGKASEILEHYDRVAKIAEYNTRLNDQDFLQSIMLVQQLQRVLTYCIVYFIEPKFRKYFHNFSFIFDGKQPGKTSTMEKYIKNNVKPFLDGNSKSGHTVPVPSVWKEGHPFVDNFFIDVDNSRKGVSLNKIFNDLIFVDSRDEAGLRLVDIISNTIYSYLVNRSAPEIVHCYNKLEYAMAKEEGSSLYHILLRTQ
jgi:hypothetical protein